MSYVWALLGFCALIILHEGGHFAAAKAVGMRVEKFSLFFGPMIVKKTIGETVYGIGTIPLGGYVKITGMSPEEVFEEPAVEARAYVNMAVWKRIVVILAGPVVNLVLAFLILFCVYVVDGQYVENPKVQEISAITAKSPAAKAGLKPGDVIVSVNGKTTEQGILKAVDASRCPGAQTQGCIASPAVTMVIRRNGATHRYAIHPEYDAKLKRALVGFSYGPGERHTSISAGYAARVALTEMGDVVGRTASVLGRIWQSKERSQLQGVVGGYEYTQKAIEASTTDGLILLAEISLALGIFNLLPFLPLDGGHIFWALVEKVRNRRTSLITMERASYVGIAIVLVLFVIGLSNSIHTLTHGGYHVP